MKKQKLKTNKGITLIALIITIIILLILATVSIKLLVDNGIIGRAKNATEQYTVEDEKEKIKLGYSDYKIAQIENSETAELKVNGAEVTPNGENSWLITFEKTGNQYELKDGDITQIKGIALSKDKVTLQLEEGKTVTEKITATLNSIEGDITWENSNNEVATIEANGNEVTITALAKGETIVTAKCGNYSAECSVKVTEPIEVGSYVHYDVEYKDMYSGQTFNADNGWRYLGKDDNGNNLIVSTGIPGILYYNFEGENGTWWDSNEALNPNERAANGMKNNFENIPFSYKATGTSVSTPNTGIFRKVGVATNGTLPSTAFRADGVEVIGVHNLTLEELNRATNKASGSNRADTSTSSGFKDLEGTALGLFDMRKIDGYGESTNYYYWLASPHPSGADDVCFVYYNNSDVYNGDNFSLGVRPVVCLSSDVPLTIIE